MIKVTAIGNIGKDAVVREVGEYTVVQFSIASSKKVKGEDVSTWLNCQKWNADKLAPYLKKGTKVMISGDLDIRKVDDKYFTTVTVQELEFAGGKQDNSSDDSSDLPY